MKVAHKKPETFQEAITYLEWSKDNGNDFIWSIQYYGFGEHLTFWRGDGTFTDFSVDKGTAINLSKLKDIIIDSAVSLWEYRNETDILIDESINDIMSKQG